LREGQDMNDIPGMPQARARRAPPSSAAREGQYLVFRLGPVDCGIEIQQVRDIVGMLPAAPRPGVPSFVKGYITLREKVMPLIDLRARFALPAQEETENSCIIVVEAQGKEPISTLGLMADEVREVLQIPKEQMLPPVAWGAPIPTEFIYAMAHVGNTPLVLLDIVRVLEPACT
ncbi:MAG TPA: chemotaxis protein CheW, partial [Candidatus Hydrogenedentes bacterium]|nr:chemotaxis protein CheW [Candidatus Hydrogenedentota bacterium]